MWMIEHFLLCRIAVGLLIEYAMSCFVEGQTRSKVMSLASTLARQTRACRLWRAKVRACWRTARAPARPLRWWPSRQTRRGLWELRPGGRPSQIPRIHCTRQSVWLVGGTTTRKSKTTCEYNNSNNNNNNNNNHTKRRWPSQERLPLLATIRFNSALQCGRCLGYLNPHNPRGRNVAVCSSTVLVLG